MSHENIDVLSCITAVGALIEPTNLMKMKNTILGQSAPSLTGGPFVTAVSFCIHSSVSH